MLQNGLSCSERTRDAECSALGNRKECVDDSYLHDEGLIRPEALLIAVDRFLDWPAENHGELSLLTLRALDRGYVVTDVVCALSDNGCDFPVNIIKTERNHDLVGEDPLRDGTQCIAGSEFVTNIADRSELPVLVRDRVKVHSPLEEEAAVLCKRRKRILKSVVDLSQKTRPELDAHQLSCELDSVADLYSVSHLVDLHAGLVPVDPDDLSLESCFAGVDECDFILGDGTFKGDSHKVSIHTCHMSNCFCHKHSVSISIHCYFILNDFKELPVFLVSGLYGEHVLAKKDPELKGI